MAGPLPAISICCTPSADVRFRVVNCGMNIALRKAMTVHDYLAWAAVQSEAPRTELINGQIVFMSPEPIVHTRIKGAVFGL